MKLSLCAAAALISLCPLASADLYQCQQSDGCTAFETVDGVPVAVPFRKGDIVETEDGWTVPPDSGWKRLHVGPMGPPPPPPPRSLWEQVWDWVWR